MPSARSAVRRVSYALLGLVLVAPLALQVVPARGEAPAVLDQNVYLPLVQTPGAVIWGLVTDSGVPAGGLIVDLWFHNGTQWEWRAAAATNANGRYEFSGVPALAAGQKYGVEYYNETDESNLAFWDTADLTSLAAGASVNMGSFDVANIELLAPTPGVTVTLPSEFQWAPRGVAGDSYEFNLFDYADGDPWFYSELLGGAGGYTLAGLPAGFAWNTPYVWDVWVYGPAGYGASYWAYYITFSGGPQLGVVHKAAVERLSPRSSPVTGLSRALGSGGAGE